MASVIRNIEAIKKFFGDNYKIVVEKIEEEGISLSRRSTKYVNELIAPIANWVDYVRMGNINDIKQKTIQEMTNEFYSWFNEYKTNFTTQNLKETNRIIFDYRQNESGFYWVSLNSHYNLDMIIRLDNCGRVNYGHNLIELREDKDGYNYSHVVIVIDEAGVIYQIKGKSNNKPKPEHYEFIYDFLVRFEPIPRITSQFQPENDFKLIDLNGEQKELLKKEKPHLFKITYI